MGRLLYWALILVIAAGFASGTPVPPQNGANTTTVSDSVYLADGTPAAGTLIITWPAFVTAEGTAVAAGSTSVKLGIDGELSVALAPNAGAMPAGVHYTVVHQMGPGQVKTEYWSVPTRRLQRTWRRWTTPGSGLAAQPVSMQYINSALAATADDGSVVHSHGSEMIGGAKSGSGTKDAAMSFLENALATVDAVGGPRDCESGEISEDISKIIDGAGECLNASTWAKGGTPASSSATASN